MSPPRHAERAMGPALERHYQFVLWLIPTLEKMPRAQKFLLGDRLQTLALQVLDDLIGATYSKARRAPLQRANLGLEKLRILVRLAQGRCGSAAAGPVTDDLAWHKDTRRGSLANRVFTPMKGHAP